MSQLLAPIPLAQQLDPEAALVLAVTLTASAQALAASYSLAPVKQSRRQNCALSGGLGLSSKVRHSMTCHQSHSVALVGRRRIRS